MKHRMMLPLVFLVAMVGWRAGGAEEPIVEDLMDDLEATLDEHTAGAAEDEDEEIETAAAPEPQPKYIASIALGGSYPERVKEALLPGMSSGSNLMQLLYRLRKAGDDPEVGAVLLRMDEYRLALSFSQVQEIARAIDGIRERGKRVDALLNNTSQAQYYLAAHCDSITIAPSGVLMLTGVQMSAFYLKDLLQTLGLQFDVVRVGKYKDAAEMLTRSSMSDSSREALGAIADLAWSEMIDTIATGRKLSPAIVEMLIDNGPYDAARALEVGLVDHIARGANAWSALYRHYPEHFEVARDYGRSKSRNQPPRTIFELSNYMMQMLSPPQDTSSQQPHVAVLYADGTIYDGVKPRDFLMQSDGVYGANFVHTVQQLRWNENVKAVVLRVNSPGGSAGASDRIAAALRELAAEKPLIVSMGSVAASGGYYISAPADVIYASPLSITGSIGVIGGKLVTGGMWRKAGVAVETVSRGRHARVWSADRGFSDSERKALQRLLDAVYDDFLQVVADGRGMSTDDVAALAQGRVWTGRDAHRHGLVDRLGGLADALTEAKDRAGVGVDERIPVVAYPRPEGLHTLFSAAPSQEAARQALLRETAAAVADTLLPRPVVQQVRSLMPLLRPGEMGILAVSPWVLQTEMH